MKTQDKFKVKEKDRGKRLDIFLMEQINSSRADAQKLIKNNLVLLNNNQPKKAGQVLKIDDIICITKNEDKKIENFVKKEPKVIEETDDYIVIDKPAGLIVHPTEANEQYTLVSWLLDRYPDIKNVGDSEKRPGIVHRLDKDASGVMVVSKDQKLFEWLKKQFQNREVDKEYSVLVHGLMDTDNDKIDFDIDRGVDGKMVARPKTDITKLKNIGKEQSGREALTEFWVEERFARFSLLKVKIYTGRTHQIRVHMLAYNHPVVGDKLYFNKKLNRKRDEELGRLFLHSNKLCFNNLKNERVCYMSDLPEKLKDFLVNLK
jgi:23S rRNA pseudouridine1911/1915/1917 synthase